MTGQFANLLTVAQWTRAQIETLFARADDFRRGASSRALANQQLATLFLEPSPRTQPSFARAMQLLGGNVQTINPAPATWLDAVRACDANALVLRHPETGAAQRAANATALPVINAGDGSGENPAQTLIDLYAIYVEKNTLDHLCIALVGDLQHSSAAHSLARAFALFSVDLSFVAPAALAMPPDICDDLRERGLSVEETNDLPKTVQKMDVVYMTGMQRERFADPKLYEKFKTFFVLTPELVRAAKPQVTILHPTWHGDEIAREVDALPNAAYTRQAENGLFVRMALLETMLAPRG